MRECRTPAPKKLEAETPGGSQLVREGPWQLKPQRLASLHVPVWLCCYSLVHWMQEPISGAHCEGH